MTAIERLTHDATGLVSICAVGRLTPDRGVAALVDGRQVAVFLLSLGELHAVDNVDPCSGAGVISRGSSATSTVSRPWPRRCTSNVSSSDRGAASTPT